MKKVLGILVALVLVAVFIGTGVFLYRKSQAKPVVYATEAPVRTDIVKKTVATGSVVPRKEVELKPVVSGIIDELYVEPGQVVKQGELIARVQLIPNMVSLSSSESRVNRAKIALDNAQKDLERNRGLAADGTISASSFQQFELAYNNAKEELQAAVDNLDLIRKGTSARRGNTTNTLVRATISGMVLEVPVEVGSSVIEANNFNAGTTIATLADMTDMIFEGKVDESEVGKIKPGMALLLTIGAAQDRQVKATLERIAPKGVAENGAIQFEIRAAITPQPDLFIRANYSANADIVLDRHDQVLAINEALLQFDEGKPYVEVETAPQQFARRDIETGLSDGIQIEVVSGLSETDNVKNPSLDTAAAATAGGGARATGLAQTRPRRAG